MGWEWVNANKTHSQMIPHPELLNKPHQKETRENMTIFQLPGGVFDMTPDLANIYWTLLQLEEKENINKEKLVVKIAVRSCLP